MSEADVYVTPGGLIAKIEVSTHDLEYRLVSVETQDPMQNEAR